MPTHVSKTVINGICSSACWGVGATDDDDEDEDMIPYSLLLIYCNFRISSIV